MGRIRIVGARVVTPDGVKPAEVTFDTDTGKIVSMDDGYQGCDISSYVPAEPLDASGMWLVPGGIDPHVHYGGFGDIPIADDFWTGSLGALAGGTTTVMDFCEPTEEEDARAVIARRMADASSSAVDYAFHFVLSEQYESLLEDLGFIEDECGIRDYKLFTVYGNTTLSLDDVREIFERLAGDAFLRRHVAVACARIGHFIGHADDRKRQCFRLEQNRRKQDTVRENRFVLRVDTGDKRLRMSHTGKGVHHLRQIYAASGRERFLRADAQDSHRCHNSSGNTVKSL